MMLFLTARKKREFMYTPMLEYAESLFMTIFSTWLAENMRDRPPWHTITGNRVGMRGLGHEGTPPLLGMLLKDITQCILQ